MATATIVTVGMAAGMATTANPRTAPTAIPPTAIALTVMAIGATAMATAAATGNGGISRLPSLTPGSRGRRRGFGGRALGDGSPKGRRLGGQSFHSREKLTIPSQRHVANLTAV